MKKFFEQSYKDKQDNLEQFGYARFDCLNSSDIAKLSSAYNNHTKASHQGFHPTMFHEDEQYRRTLNETITNILKPRLEGVISDQYTILYGNYMVKEPGASSAMKIHQDWTYVDEQKYRSYAIWIPLVDLTDKNGVFTVIPGSHQLTTNKRGPGVYCPFFEHTDFINDHLSVPIYLSAGEAVCWDHRLAHSSPANFSGQSRIAITVIMVPKNVEIYHYYKSDDASQLETYAITADFFMGYKIGERPDLNPIKCEKYTHQALTRNELQTIVNKGS